MWKLFQLIVQCVQNMFGNDCHFVLWKLDVIIVFINSSYNNSFGFVYVRTYTNNCYTPVCKLN